jgi:arylsulfatase A-like enzyme
MLGAQGLMGKNIWYEEAIKIPLMICDREVTPGRTDILFSSEDHMPTLLELLDVFVPACVEGKSFAGYLGKQMASVVAEDDEKLIMMIPGMPEMVDAYRRRGYNNKAFGWRGLRTKDTTYVVDNGTKTGAIQKRYLYDLVEDPLQKKPIELDRQDPLAQQMDKKLNEYLTKTNDPFMLDQIEWR